MKPNRSQIEAAKSVIGQYGKNYANTGSDLHQNTATMAVFALLIGQLRSVPAEYANCANGVELSADNESQDAETPNDGVFLTVEEHARMQAILSGITFEEGERRMLLSEDAAALVRSEGSNFPEAGIYITYTDACGMVEQVMVDATHPDTIIGKQIRSLIATEDGFGADEDDAEDDTEEDISNGSDDSDPPGQNFEPMTVAELRAFATTNGVDLRDMSKKADIIAGLREHGY